METMLGTVQAFAFDYAPHGWLPCDGRLMNINDNSSLYSLLGTQYGGNGQDTFALPDLRGKVAVGVKKRVGEHYGIAAEGGDTQAVELNYCICVKGYYPSRANY